jgi:prokaryotic ubiquitin-like protein Pup
MGAFGDDARRNGAMRSRTMGYLAGALTVSTGRLEKPTDVFSRPVTMQEAAMAQEQTKRGGGGGDDDDLTASTAAGQERREKLTEETDDLLDEIDDVLEENAEDFVRAYVQKGGQ